MVSPVVHDVWIHADINGGLQFAGFNLLIPMGNPVKVRLPATPQIPYYFAIGGNSWSPRHRTSFTVNKDGVVEYVPSALLVGAGTEKEPLRLKS
ncbi:MAG: hypothetical protein GYA24_13465 [Candidatus Lokiarchaeota archaeon]|nr:hypothetical protein [Candidatus Lokiarchaeota archaeon]